MDQKTLELNAPELYINRELSLLEFNRRVLELSKDGSNPLLERLKYLCIASSNLDEFFEIRVAGLKQQVVYRSATTGPDQIAPVEQIKRISEVAHEFVAEQYRILNDELIPLLADEAIHFLKRSQWDTKQAGWVKQSRVNASAESDWLRSLASVPAHSKQESQFSCVTRR